MRPERWRYESFYIFTYILPTPSSLLSKMNLDQLPFTPLKLGLVSLFSPLSPPLFPPNLLFPLARLLILRR